MTEKDYSLLRPFDLDAAKAGAPILAVKPMEERSFVIGLDSEGSYITATNQGVFKYGKDVDYRMAPLCWVEGKPVYPGDVLWQSHPSGAVFERTVKGLSSRGEYLEFEGSGAWATDGTASVLTWENPRPKPVRRWINIYNIGYATKDDAEKAAGSSRIACVEIELPPLKP